MKGARIRIGIEARDRGVVTSRHPAVAAVEFPAKFSDIEAPGEPAAHRLVDTGQGGHLVGKPRRRLLVGLPLDQVGQEFALRIFFDVRKTGARDRSLASVLGLARYRGHRRQAGDILQQARAGIVAEVEFKFLA